MAGLCIISFTRWIHNKIFFALDCPHSILIGDGFCNDETNNAECLYDHGDCCLSKTDTSYCSECTCAFKGFITSPRFHEVYDISWLIQVPHGQQISLKFLSLDVSCRFNPDYISGQSVLWVLLTAPLSLGRGSEHNC